MPDEAHADQGPVDGGEAGTIETLKKLQHYHDRNKELIAEVRRTREIWDRAKAEAKETRAAHDEAVADLLAFGNDEQLPLMQMAAEKTEGEDTPTPWREYELCELKGLKPKLIEKLNDAGVRSVGDLADFQGEHGEFWSQDIRGVGAKAQRQIEDAWIAFWSDHPEAHDEWRAAAVFKRIEMMEKGDGPPAEADEAA